MKDSVLFIFAGLKIPKYDNTKHLTVAVVSHHAWTLGHVSQNIISC